MTRFCVAILCGITAASVGLTASFADVPSDPVNDYDTLVYASDTLAEIEPNYSGFAEDDDLPSYLSARPDPERQARTNEKSELDFALATASRSVLEPDGPGGLRWSILSRLALLALLCLAVVFYGGPRRAAR